MSHHHRHEQTLEALALYSLSAIERKMTAKPPRDPTPAELGLCPVDYAERTLGVISVQPAQLRHR